MDADQRIVAVTARMGELTALHLPLAKPCSECRFGPLDGTGAGICEHYAHWQITANLLNGKRSGRVLVSTMEARSESGLCGPEGLLFEPYGWRKIFRWLHQKEETGAAIVLIAATIIGLVAFALLFELGRHLALF